MEILGYDPKPEETALFRERGRACKVFVLRRFPDSGTGMIKYRLQIKGDVPGYQSLKSELGSEFDYERNPGIDPSTDEDEERSFLEELN